MKSSIICTTSMMLMGMDRSPTKTSNSQLENNYSQTKERTGGRTKKLNSELSLAKMLSVGKSAKTTQSTAKCIGRSTRIKHCNSWWTLTVASVDYGSSSSALSVWMQSKTIRIKYSLIISRKSANFISSGSLKANTRCSMNLSQDAVKVDDNG